MYSLATKYFLEYISSFRVFEYQILITAMRAMRNAIFVHKTSTMMYVGVGTIAVHSSCCGCCCGLIISYNIVLEAKSTRLVENRTDRKFTIK